MSHKTQNAVVFARFGKSLNHETKYHQPYWHKAEINK